MNWILWIIGWLGHIGIWATVFNQIHATAVPKNSRKLSEIVILVIVGLPILLAFLALIPMNRVLELLQHRKSFDAWPLYSTPENLFLNFSMPQDLGIYGYLCVAAGSFFSVRWTFRKLTAQSPAGVLKDTGLIRNLKQELRAKNASNSGAHPDLLHGWLARSLALIPFNQVLLAEVKQLELKLNVPMDFDGLRICHLSDLHFTGQIDRRYFQEIMEIANDFQPQLTLITGDLLDKDRCIPWIASTLGRLRADLGCYFVFGNHDLLVKDQSGYLAELSKFGLKRVSQWTRIPFGRSVIQLAGNELPWYCEAEELNELGEKQENEFRLLITHSPDQIRWARRFGFDLILAGHNHGGQIRFPLIGAVIVPSRYGVKYASGTFEVNPSIMHVSRGISGDEPIRINCPPEIGLITIRSSRS
jgi:predicted MPP superfamily phosphohydrolase